MLRFTSSSSFLAYATSRSERKDRKKEYCASKLFHSKFIVWRDGSEGSHRQRGAAGLGDGSTGRTDGGGQRRRLRSVVKGGHLAVDLLAVKISVVVAGGANHGLQSVVLGCRYELIAFIDSVAIEADGVVLLAFSVPYRNDAKRPLSSLAVDF
ncbi:hypothetical protein V8G54_027561 [Vigna mungo]|uniref:Uncharacterized protein n=1 Tax=Vigna mungo TaxID=3915 RepID=A0AAQ3N2T3_VIGMU